ncbi:hypothetical protein H6G89_13315 [Oscillatoria sp. FACHB-1407]|uniref:hypothetical protein n=1 Tax=Oscillatoria sp. FACHB-1407 TaxID=2692847 RepID=UPI0016845717|nr:hypothetical protein [Oscillatoria sp. FACHB-1407]MBD2462028.1 hypothetical protein [Oscillatoria sp. FACHB-1407]
MNSSKLTGLEQITLTELTVHDFWSWAYSDILSNRNRSIFAEFIVAAALGLTHRPRVEWDAVDLHYCDKKIEVKSSAYIQSWQQKKPSLIKFDISKKKGWDAETNIMSELRCRLADCYVFSLYEEKDINNANVLDLKRWIFLVVSTDRIDESFGDQKMVVLARLKQLGILTSYEGLKQAIDLTLKL